MLVALEVETEALSKADLKEIVIEGLLGETHFASRLLQTVPDQLSALGVDVTIKKPAPKLHLLNYEIDAALLRTSACYFTLVRIFVVR